MAEIDSVLRNLDWCDGGGEGREEGKEGRGAILLFKRLIYRLLIEKNSSKTTANFSYLFHIKHHVKASSSFFA